MYQYTAYYELHSHKHERLYNPCVAYEPLYAGGSTRAYKFPNNTMSISAIFLILMYVCRLWLSQNLYVRYMLIYHLLYGIRLILCSSRGILDCIRRKEYGLATAQD